MRGLWKWKLPASALPIDNPNCFLLSSRNYCCLSPPVSLEQYLLSYASNYSHYSVHQANKFLIKLYYWETINQFWWLLVRQSFVCLTVSVLVITLLIFPSYFFLNIMKILFKCHYLMFWWCFGQKHGSVKTQCSSRNID